MRLKNGVRMTSLCPQIVLALAVCEEIFNRVAQYKPFVGNPAEDQTMVITSLNDGRHGNNSWHYKGRAVDLRTKNITNGQEVYMEIFKQLNDDFDILFEDIGGVNEHIHIEYDPK